MPGDLRFVFSLTALLCFVQGSNLQRIGVDLLFNQNLQTKFDEVKAQNGDQTHQARESGSQDSNKTFTTVEEILALVNKATHTVSRMVEMSNEASRTAAEMQDLITALTMKASKLLVEQPTADEVLPEQTTTDEVLPEQPITNEILPEPTTGEVLPEQLPTTGEQLLPEQPTTDEVLPEQPTTDEVLPEQPTTDEVLPEQPTTDEQLLPDQSTVQTEIKNSRTTAAGTMADKLPLLPGSGGETPSDTPAGVGGGVEPFHKPVHPTTEFIYTTLKPKTEPSETNEEEPPETKVEVILDTNVSEEPEHTTGICYTRDHAHHNLDNRCSNWLFYNYHTHVAGWDECSKFTYKHGKRCGYLQAKCKRSVKKNNPNQNWYCCASVRCIASKRWGLHL